MKVVAYPADVGGCGYYRVIAPGQALADLGYDITIVTPDDPAEEQLQAAWRGDEVVDVVAPDADVVVLQRPLQGKVANAIPFLQAQGVKVVVEVDDDFEHISPRNVSAQAVDPLKSPHRNREHLRRACEMADLVTVSTPALADVYGRHGRVAVLPNYVPAWYLSVEQDAHDGVYVGWSGSTETHPDDLQVCGQGIANAIRKTGAQMAVVGTGIGVAKRLGLQGAPLACGWRSLAEYPEAMAQFDVGIVPLEDSLFNQAKSWLKMLEMAALGVPCVVSPTVENVRGAGLGLGVVADRPREWEGLVKRLVVDAGYRAEQAQRGRAAASMLTVQGNCERWWEAWATLVNTPCAV